MTEKVKSNPRTIWYFPVYNYYLVSALSGFSVDLLVFAACRSCYFCCHIFWFLARVMQNRLIHEKLKSVRNPFWDNQRLVACQERGGVLQQKKTFLMCVRDYVYDISHYLVSYKRDNLSVSLYTYEYACTYQYRRRRKKHFVVEDFFDARKRRRLY